MTRFLKSRKIRAILLLFLFFVSINCSPHIAFYDQYAYTQATSLKVDLQNLATESSTVTYSDAKTEIDKINVQIQKALEYSRGRAKNTLSTGQYQVLYSDNGFYKTFLKTWSSEGKLSPAGADETGKELGELMDQIIKLESGKTKQDR